MIKRFWHRIWPKQPLAIKITAALAFLVAAAVVSATSLSILSAERVIRADLEDQASLVLETLAMSLAKAVASEDAEALESALQDVDGSQTITAVRFYNRAGELISPKGIEEDGDPAFVQQVLASPEPIFRWGEDHLMAGRQIEYQGVAAGAATVAIAMAPTEAKIASLSSQALLAALIIIAVGIALGLLLSRSITEPLGTWVRAAKQIGKGDLSRKVSIESRDELADLANAFNDMTDQLQERDARRSAILAAALDGIISFDQSGQIIECNPAARSMFGIPTDRPLKYNIAQWVRFEHGDDSSRRALIDHLTAQSPDILDQRVEAVGMHTDGTTFPIDLAVTRVSAAGPILYTAVARDITEVKRSEAALQRAQQELERRVEDRTSELAQMNTALQAQMEELGHAEQALRESEERYFLATRGAKDGLWDWDLRKGRIYFSQRWKSMLGYEDHEIGDHKSDWLMLIHAEDRPQVEAELSAHLEGLSPQFESEHRMLHKDGEYRWVLSRALAVQDERGSAYRMAGSQSDITARKQIEEQLLHDAFHDALTGLPNRALFLDRLGRAIERSRRREDYQFAVLFLDLDRFKVINDSLGHTKGDEVLIAIAHRLEFFLRTADTVARLGGDEFVILLEDLDAPEDALRVAERIQDELKLPFYLDDQKVFTGVSIGIVLSTTGYSRPEEILRDADIAMYRAKALGRARSEVFDTEMRTTAMVRLELENDLRRAIGFQEFKVYYQPIISLENNRITGFEALVRWQHPERGLIPPEEFIGVAEETGLIVPIDWWVLREACKQLAVWHAEFGIEPPLTMSVNVSGKHFVSLDLVRQVEHILETTDVLPESVKLELTESVFMEEDEIAADAFAQLRNLGLQLQIDDFGTGYSSLGYLQRFPVDTIKIDRSFVSKMSTHSTNAEIVRTIVMLARELDMNAIAEGVETEEQLLQLKKLACEFGQGFLISEPMDHYAAGQMVAQMIATETL